jgi:hypothetical protein
MKYVIMKTKTVVQGSPWTRKDLFGVRRGAASQRVQLGDCRVMQKESKTRKYRGGFSILSHLRFLKELL